MLRHLPLIASEVRRIFCMTQAFKDAQHEAGRLLIKRVLRDGESEAPILAQARQRMLDAAVSDEAEMTQRTGLIA